MGKWLIDQAAELGALYKHAGNVIGANAGIGLGALGLTGAGAKVASKTAGNYAEVLGRVGKGGYGKATLEYMGGGKGVAKLAAATGVAAVGGGALLRSATSGMDPVSTMFMNNKGESDIAGIPLI